jgi:hypothetical protein
MAEDHAKRGKKRGGGTVIVATQSCFHRDMLDGEQIALNPLKFYLVPNLQVATLVIRKKSEIVQIHWLSFNQPLDPKLFELSTVNDISKLRKLIDPELCGAERLR